MTVWETTGNPEGGSREPAGGARDPLAGPREPTVSAREILSGAREPMAGSREPIKFPATKEERREQRMRRRGEREAGETIEGAILPQPDLNPDDASRKPLRRKDREKVKERGKTKEKQEITLQEQQIPLRRHLQVSWTLLSFLLMVAIPSAATGFYYWLMASPQYVVETQFSVRGSSQSSVTSLGLTGILGGSVQNNDSYIVSAYINSAQLIRDVQSQLGVDLRQYYSRANIDMLYRIDADMPIEKFTDYWQNMIEISFNTTTGNTTLYVYAFSADDSKAITDAVLKVSETLVNNLSESSRQQMMALTSKQVDRSEDRLRKVQSEMRELRKQVKTVDINTLTQTQQALTQQLENQLQSLKTRLSTARQSLSEDSPTVRVLNKQIKSAEAALQAQQQKMTDSSSDGNDQRVTNGNVAAALNRFEELTIEQGFATQAYTSALAAFETALTEAQKQERYFATFVEPTRPEIALYPLRLMDSFIAFLCFLAVWMISQFLYRSFRDHAI